MIKYSNLIGFKATYVSEAMMNHFHFYLRFLTQISSNFGMYVFFKQFVLNPSKSGVLPKNRKS